MKCIVKTDEQANILHLYEKKKYWIFKVSIYLVQL